jgi:hypothetical protein
MEIPSTRMRARYDPLERTCLQLLDDLDNWLESAGFLVLHCLVLTCSFLSCLGVFCDQPSDSAPLSGLEFNWTGL